ncbi:MAG: hypothetical protein VW835_07700, partial [Rickettsiales bacterium]
MSSDFESNSYLYGTNETYLAQMYARYLQDPGSVDPEWAEIFADLAEDEKSSFLDEQQGASWAPRKTSVIGGNGDSPSMSDATEGMERRAMPAHMMGMPYMPAASEQIRQATMDSIRALMLIRNYRVRGHLHCDLDPLGIVKPLPHSELDPESFGFS